MKQSGQIQEQNKQKFYDALLIQREAFEQFYKDQLPCFKQVMETFIADLDEQTIPDFYSKIPTGQFIKSNTEYCQYIDNSVKEYNKKSKKIKLKNLWFEKTGTKDPEVWSERYETPILCMFNDSERSEAKEMFDIMLAYSTSDANINKSISYLENATFYERLDDPAERDKCFMDRVVGEYAIMLNNADDVRSDLTGHISDKVYNWMDNTIVKNRLKILAEKQYKLNGYERAQAVIDKMDASELRHYLNDLIADNLTVGMEILKNE
jgi:hypothetical protein